MKQVVTAIGLQAGQLIWMRPHEADAAVATGAAMWPDDPKVEPFRERLGLNKPAADVSRRELQIKRVDGGNELVGAWPKHIVMQPRMLASNMVVSHPSGAIQITIGKRTATYRAISSPREGGILADLVEVTGEPVAKVVAPVEKEPVAAPDPSKDSAGAPSAGPTSPVARDDGKIPADWQSLHWKHRIRLAERISGRKVTDVEEANAIIENAADAVSN